VSRKSELYLAVDLYLAGDVESVRDLAVIAYDLGRVRQQEDDARRVVRDGYYTPQTALVKSMRAEARRRR
jgi:hypothetical protein